jgi:transcriptional/translational regulatory protein YebC/TACO1
MSFLQVSMRRGSLFVRTMRNKATPTARKAKLDKERDKITTRFARMIKVAVASGNEIRVEEACKDATRAGVRSAVIERILSRHRDRGGRLEEVLYEGTLPGGVCVLIEVLTDKKTRTAPDIRHVLSEGGGALGTSGSAAWAFNRRAVLSYAPSDENVDDLLDGAMGLDGVEDVADGVEGVEVWVEPGVVGSVRDALLAMGHASIGEQLLYVPSAAPVAIDDSDSLARIEETLETLRHHDDVEEVWHNVDVDSA